MFGGMTCSVNMAFFQQQLGNMTNKDTCDTMGVYF